MTDELSEIIERLRVQLADQLPPDQQQWIEPFAETMAPIIADLWAKMQAAITADAEMYAALFEQRAHESPLSVATPGLLLAAKILRATSQEEA